MAQICTEYIVNIYIYEKFVKVVSESMHFIRDVCAFKLAEYVVNSM